MSNVLSNMGNKRNFVFTSGDAVPLGICNLDRRFMVAESKPEVRRPEVLKIVEQLRSIYPDWHEDRLVTEAKATYFKSAMKSMVTR